MSRNLKRALVAATLVVSWTAGAQALAVRSGFDGTTLAANDDGSAGPLAIGFDINFFGVTSSTLFANNNGNITFDAALSTFTPFDLTSTGTQIIAPFFGDVDTRGAGSGLMGWGAGTVGGRAAFGVTWDQVGYFSAADDKLNTFQVVLIDRSDIGAGDFDFEFNYGQIQWETGSASDGTDGLGGNSARVGFSNGTGDPGTFFELAGSAVNGAFLDGGPNALVNAGGGAGRLTFSVRNGEVTLPPEEPTGPSVVPLPAAAPLLLAGLAGLALLRRRRA